MNTSNKMKMKLETICKMTLALLACALPLTLHAAAPPKVARKRRISHSRLWMTRPFA